LAAERGASWVEVCTSAGAKWIQAVGGSAEQAPTTDGDGPHGVEHCAYCSLQAGTPALPSKTGAWVPVLFALAYPPIALQAAPRALHAWIHAQPRAPPQFT
jgi:hypothetical protein